jgi:hypothetical protein
MDDINSAHGVIVGSRYYGRVKRRGKDHGMVWTVNQQRPIMAFRGITMIAIAEGSARAGVEPL